MVGPTVTPLPFKREFPSAKITCPACKAGLLERDKSHTHVPGSCRFPPCPGCRHKRHMDHRDHTRNTGECKLHGILRIAWKCPGCQRELKRGEWHNAPEGDPGSCRFHGIDPRESGRPIQGAHPRDPAVPARVIPLRLVD